MRTLAARDTACNLKQINLEIVIIIVVIYFQVVQMLLSETHTV